MFHKSTVRSLASILLCSALAAQTGYDTAPSGLKGNEGNTYSNLLGAFAEGRMQFANAGLDNKRSKMISRIYFRRDKGRAYLPRIGAGRTWQNVELWLGEGNILKMRKKNYKTWENFDNPYGRKPTRVFSGRWSFPEFRGRESSGNWSSIPRLPFSQPWLHRRSSYHLVMDFKFAGGALTNSTSWGKNTIPYYLDGVFTDPTQEASVAGQSLGSGSCNDSAIYGTSPASTTLNATVYGGLHATTSLRGKLQFATSSSYTAPRALVVQALAVHGNFLGYSIGAGCQRLYADPAAIIAVLRRSTDGGGHATGSLTMPFEPAFAGVRVFGQSAWLDSKTGLLSLTKASHVVLPATPIVVPPRLAVWSRSRNAGYPDVLPSADRNLQPLPLFAFTYQ